MTPPITLADLRELARTERLGMLDCRRYVDQLLAAPERVKVSERWEFRASGWRFVARPESVLVTYRERKHFPSVTRERISWTARGYMNVRVVHVTVYRAVKR